ncbi:MAG: phosphatidylinositol-3-phosphatase, partial [Ilumatobacteraceae bacterium]
MLVVLLVFITACATATEESTVSSVAAQRSSPTAPSPVSTTEGTIVLPSTVSPTTVANAGPCGQPGSAPPTYDHVIWIWMENKNSNEVFDSQHAPFMSRLAELCGAASNYVDHGIHPSLPNY